MKKNIASMLALTILISLFGTTPVKSLQPSQGLESVHFAVIGDYGDTSQAELDVSNLVKSWTPDFVLTVGDNNYHAGGADTIDQNIGQYYHEFINPYVGSYGSGATVNRFFPSLGNHDWEAPNAQPYLDYFALPGNERYYDYVRGPVHFFALDSDEHEPDGNTHTSTQAIWLKNGLLASSSEWNIVYFHHPPYSSGSHGSNAVMQWPFALWGADAVISGHDHTYERIFKNGIPYFVNGLGGHSLYPFNTPVSGSVVRYNSDYGAMLIDADTTSINFQMISRTGDPIDSYLLDKASPTAVINSTAPFDGQILESSETSNAGAVINSHATTLKLGDDARNRQYRAILHFNTSFLPDNAIVTSATLSFKYAGKSGTLPFGTHGNLLADIRKGSFTNNPILQSSDFHKPASKNKGFSFNGTLSDDGWYSQSINAIDLAFINRAGPTQFRLRFTRDDNNDFGPDHLKIYSANAEEPNRPQLILEYYIP